MISAKFRLAWTFAICNDPAWPCPAQKSTVVGHAWPDWISPTRLDIPFPTDESARATNNVLGDNFTQPRNLIWLTLQTQQYQWHIVLLQHC
eukprot:3904492-Lingulodinium_polyedra.AAC.1